MCTGSTNKQPLHGWWCLRLAGVGFCLLMSDFTLRLVFGAVLFMVQGLFSFWATPAANGWTGS